MMGPSYLQAVRAAHGLHLPLALAGAQRRRTAGTLAGLLPYELVCTQSQAGTEQ